MAHQDRFFDAFRKWLKRKNLSALYVWVRENAEKKKWHTHVLAHVPPELWEELEVCLLRAGRFDEPPSGVTDRHVKITGGWSWDLGAYRDAQWAGEVRYFLKSVSPRAMMDGERVWDALGLDDRGRKPQTIAGKRSGVSNALSRAARCRAKWRELFTLAQLRDALPTAGKAMRLPTPNTIRPGSRGFAFAGLG
jgi:hypothetical protein